MFDITLLTSRYCSHSCGFCTYPKEDSVENIEQVKASLQEVKKLTDYFNKCKAEYTISIGCEIGNASIEVLDCLSVLEQNFYIRTQGGFTKLLSEGTNINVKKIIFQMFPHTALNRIETELPQETRVFLWGDPENLLEVETVTQAYDEVDVKDTGEASPLYKEFDMKFYRIETLDEEGNQYLMTEDVYNYYELSSYLYNDIARVRDVCQRLVLHLTVDLNAGTFTPCTYYNNAQIPLSELVPFFKSRSNTLQFDCSNCYMDCFAVNDIQILNRTKLWNY